MDIMKKFFPLSFKYTKSVVDLIVGIIVYILVGAIGGAIIFIASLIPVVGILVGIVGWILDVYVAVGVILLILAFLKVIDYQVKQG